MAERAIRAQVRRASLSRACTGSGGSTRERRSPGALSLLLTGCRFHGRRRNGARFLQCCLFPVCRPHHADGQARGNPDGERNGKQV